MYTMIMSGISYVVELDSAHFLIVNWDALPPSFQRLWVSLHFFCARPHQGACIILFEHNCLQFEDV